MFKLIANKLGSRVPSFDIAALSRQVSEFERTYSVEIKAAAELIAIRKNWPELVQAMKESGATSPVIGGGLPEWRITTVRTALEQLQRDGLLKYSFAGHTMKLGGTDSGSSGDLTIEISPDLNAVLQKRF